MIWQISRKTSLPPKATNLFPLFRSLRSPSWRRKRYELEKQAQTGSFGNKPDRKSHTGVEEVFYDPLKVPIPSFLPDTSETREELAQYYQSVSRIDQGLARLIEILQNAGLYEKTMIVFTSDHGMAFAGGKTTVYEGGLKVPFVVRNPYEKKRGIGHRPYQSHDITPSLLDFAGALNVEKNRPIQWEDPSKSYPVPKSGTPKDNRGIASKLSSYHGKSWVPILGNQRRSIGQYFRFPYFSRDSDVLPHAGLPRQEIQTYLEYRSPTALSFASDLWAASSFQAQFQKSLSAPYGKKTVRQYIHRPNSNSSGSTKTRKKQLICWESKVCFLTEEYKEKLKFSSTHFMIHG